MSERRRLKRGQTGQSTSDEHSHAPTAPRPSSLRHARQAHAFDHALALREEHDVVVLCDRADALDRRFWVYGETGLCLLARLLKLAQMRKAGTEEEEGPRGVSVSVNRFSKPRQGLFIFP
jgi:hypothetical protein